MAGRYTYTLHKIMYSTYNEQTAASHLRPVTNSESKELFSMLVKHRKPIWEFMQNRVVEIFKSTTNFFFNLSVRELFDVLALTNKFLEIGLEFANPKECPLLDETLSLCNRYMLDFKETQFNNLKDFISNEEWTRLPLPDNYQVKEFSELLTDFPPDFKKRIRIFETHFSGRILDHTSENVFTRFTEGNPFDYDDLMT